MKYRIHWKSDRTGASGHGTGTFTWEIADRIAKGLNCEHADIQLRHWTEPVFEDDKYAPITQN